MPNPFKKEADRRITDRLPATVVARRIEEERDMERRSRKIDSALRGRARLRARSA
jgi:hypothetical protein